MGDHPTAPCRLCGKPIVWATSPDGKRLPLDPRAPVYRVGADLAGTLTGTRDRDALVSHFATCSGIRQGEAPMTRAPDISGPRARAWRMSAASKPAALAVYLVHYPGAHPAWDCWLVATCHLRPIEGMPPPVLHYPTATHEVQFLALDPDYMPVPNPDLPPEGIRFLTPVDLVWQGTMTDDEAERLVQDAVKVMCKVGPPPESDYAAWWRRALPNTLEHYRTGGHAAPGRAS